MSHISEVVFDLASIAEESEEFYRLKYVRLAYDSVDDLPARLYTQLPGSPPGVTDTEDDRFIVSRDGVPDVTSMVGAVIEHEAAAGRLTVEFGDRPELLANLRPEDVVPVEEPHEMKTPRLAKRRQYAEAHEEALARRAEGWDMDESEVMAERVHKDPTGMGEGGIPPMVDRATAGQGADQITKVYLVNRKEPVLVYGELESVRDAIWHEVGGAPAPSRWVQFQRVNRDAVVSSDDVVINPAYVVSLQSERL